jgi:hypothetical protein
VAVAEIRQRKGGDLDLPAWATNPLSKAQFDLADAWVNADWTTRRRLLTEPPPGLDREDIRTLAAVSCDRPALRQWLAILDAIDRDGTDTVLADIDAAARTASVLRDWISAPTWNASQAFLQAHPELREPATLAVLEQWSDQNDTARQHLAILRLIAQVPAGDVFDAILDSTDARDLLFRVARLGDSTLIAETWIAAPSLASHSFAAPLTIALRRALAETAGNTTHNEATDEIRQAALTAATAATERELRETRTLLRGLSRTRDDRVEMLNLIAAAFSAEERS